MSEVLKPGTLILVIDHPNFHTPWGFPDLIGRMFTLNSGLVEHHVIPGRKGYTTKEIESQGTWKGCAYFFARDEFIPIHPDPTESTISETREFTPVC
jgi:hypothetical protein